jgi:hypothetical protein
MKTLAEELEEMRIRMHDLATTEHDLMNALGDALNNADSRLLDDLRNLTSDHDARRAAIVDELRRLASRLGTLPGAGELLSAGSSLPKLPPFETTTHVRSDRRDHGTSSIAEELTKHLAARPNGH